MKYSGKSLDFHCEIHEFMWQSSDLAKSLCLGLICGLIHSFFYLNVSVTSGQGCLLHNLCSSVMLRSANWLWDQIVLDTIMALSEIKSSQFLTFHPLIMKSLHLWLKSVDFLVNPWVKSSDFMDFIIPQLNPKILWNSQISLRSLDVYLKMGLTITVCTHSKQPLLFQIF